MDGARTYAQPIARLLIGLMFLVSGIGKTGDVAGFTGYMTSGGVPAFLAWPTIIFEIVAALLLIVGYQTRAVALLLAGFTLLAGLLYHFQPADQMQMILFFKNLAITGGLLMVFSHGAGALSVDERGVAEPVR